MKIIDLSQRLPGPFAGKILSDLGAEVIKIEDSKRPDPFLEFDVDQSFKCWYEELNSSKKIVRLDFSSEHIQAEIAKILQGADALLMGLPEKLKTKLGLQDENLPRPLAVVELSASRIHKSMHDLNAMAQCGLLSLHVADENREIAPPPFLPIAGISFGQQVATQTLANIINSKQTNALVKTECYLQDNAEFILNCFWPLKLRHDSRGKFLHNGAYPCYCLYRTLDGHYVAVAAVEERFWTQLIEIFQIDLSVEDRFSKDPKSFDKVKSTFAKLNADAIERLALDKDICVTIVRKIN